MHNSLREKVIDSASNRIGQPFVHHFKPDLCAHGTRTPRICYEHGLGQDGYDCSGLVIASLCDVLDMATEQWPEDIRHVTQLHTRLAEEAEPEAGDILIYASHIGILTSHVSLIHPSKPRGKVPGKVEETVDEHYFRKYKVIPLEKILAELDT